MGIVLFNEKGNGNGMAMDGNGMEWNGMGY
jgi:hypothetical protein